MYVKSNYPWLKVVISRLRDDHIETPFNHLLYIGFKFVSLLKKKNLSTSGSSYIIASLFYIQRAIRL